MCIRNRIVNGASIAAKEPKNIRMLTIKSGYMMLALAVALLLVGCGDEAAGADADEAAGSEAVRGLVVHVEAHSLISLSALEVQDDDGVVWRFDGRDKVFPEFTPSHLNEHKLLGLPVEVLFSREGDALVVQAIADYGN